MEGKIKTIEQALLYSLDHWKWIVLNHTTEHPHDIKCAYLDGVWYSQHPEFYRAIVNECFICDYCSHQTTRVSMCELCPVEWVSDQAERNRLHKYTHCEEENSPYWNWWESGKTGAAQEVVDLIKNALDKRGVKYD